MLDFVMYKCVHMYIPLTIGSLTAYAIRSLSPSNRLLSLNCFVTDRGVGKDKINIIIKWSLFCEGQKQADVQYLTEVR